MLSEHLRETSVFGVCNAGAMVPSIAEKVVPSSDKICSLLLVAWLSSKLDGITSLCTPFLPEGLLGLDLMTAKPRGSIGPGRSALLALCPALGAPGKTRTRAVGAICV